MEKNTEIIEFFICPECKGVSWERIDFIPFQSNIEFSCLAECDHCGVEVLVVDHVSRCTKCEGKIECMATPIKHTFSVAAVPSAGIGSQQLKELLKVIEECNK